MDDNRTLTLRPPVWALLLAVIIGGCFYVYGKNIEERHMDLATISVSGEGKVTSPPTIAELSFGVQIARQRTAKDAMAMLEKQMNAVFDAVKGVGIPEKDLTTEYVSLQPDYDRTSGNQMLRGYTASQSLRAKVRDLDLVSDVLSAATTAGANQAGNANFTIDEPDTLQAEAREKAIADAKEKAKKLANDLGMSLGKLKGFSESSGGWVPLPYMMRAEAAGKSMDVAQALPLPTGEQDVQVTVTLTYEVR